MMNKIAEGIYIEKLAIAPAFGKVFMNTVAKRALPGAIVGALPGMAIGAYQGAKDGGGIGGALKGGLAGGAIGGVAGGAMGYGGALMKARSLRNARALPQSIMDRIAATPGSTVTGDDFKQLLRATDTISGHRGVMQRQFQARAGANGKGFQWKNVHQPGMPGYEAFKDNLDWAAKYDPRVGQKQASFAPVPNASLPGAKSTGFFGGLMGKSPVQNPGHALGTAVREGNVTGMVGNLPGAVPGAIKGLLGAGTLVN